AGQVAWYLPRRELLQRGRFLRLRSPFATDGNETAWMVASGDGGHAIVGHFRTLARPGPVRDRLRLRGLDPGATYRISCWTDGFSEPTGTIERFGDELMSIGLGIEPPDPMPPGAGLDGARLIRGDFQARLFELVRI
ncbi:MAG TPA: GH36 C-terminal domain-containing protein, partial [Candidatus Limnocylindrales bacterium]|nr:GH36 C-terminal domain-containing protein [Candidatus Limnocylindrales bacterium]